MQLAQVNVARAVAPMDSPELADFVANLDEVNALAEAADGFVWRLKDDSGDATSIAVFDDPRMIVNLSVWESIEALEDYIYGPGHVAVLRRRREWFEVMDRPYLALWWVADGHEPSVTEAEEKLRLLEAQGPSPEAFTLKERFAPA